MVRLSAGIRAKQEWWKKYKNRDIRAKWKAEAFEQRLTWIEAATMLVPYEDRDRYLKGAHTHTVDVKLEEKQIDYVLDELDGYDKLRDDATGIEVRTY